MNDEKLIKLVREYDCIYDMTSTKYLDPLYKSTVWGSIGEKLHQTGESCKKRWSNIRDQYKRVLRKRQRQSGDALKLIKKYKYEEALQFLLPHIQDREAFPALLSHNSAAIQNTNSDSSGEEEQVDEVTVTPKVEPSTSWPQVQHSTNVPTPPISACKATVFDREADRERIILVNEGAATYSQNKPQTESASSALINYIIKNNKKTRQVDHIEAFFQGLVPTIKRFSPYNQHVIKGRIFSVVQELEFEQLNLPGPSPSAFFSRLPSPSMSIASNPEM